MTLNAFQTSIHSRFGAILFIIGKIIRFVLVLFFIIIVASTTKFIQSYTIWELIFIFATFNFIDVLAQFFMRGVYFFRRVVVGGEFDSFLVSPISPLFRSLFGAADILDSPILIISLGLLIYSASRINEISPIGILSYLILILNAIIIAFSFHVLIVSIGVVTTAVDNALWLYRDLIQMGRIPVDFYKEPLRGLITFIIPVGIMVTFPAKAVFGILSLQNMLIAFLIGLASLLISLRVWSYSLKNYQSTGS